MHALAVEQQIDWLGAVAVPVIAILVSTGVAVFLARGERRAAEHSRAVERAGVVIQALTDVSRSARMSDDPERLKEPVFDAVAAMNVLGASLPRRDAAVAVFVGTIFSKSLGREVGIVSTTALWLGTCLEGWARGEIKSSEFARSIPEDSELWWMARAYPAQWEDIIEGKLNPPL